MDVFSNMPKILGSLGNLKGTKYYLEIPTNKNSNIHVPALKCYKACFCIFLYKKDIISENGIIYYETPCTNTDDHAICFPLYIC